MLSVTLGKVLSADPIRVSDSLTQKPAKSGSFWVRTSKDSSPGLSFCWLQRAWERWERWERWEDLASCSSCSHTERFASPSVTHLPKRFLSHTPARPLGSLPHVHGAACMERRSPRSEPGVSPVRKRFQRCQSALVCVGMAAIFVTRQRIPCGTTQRWQLLSSEGSHDGIQGGHPSLPLWK